MNDRKNHAWMMCRNTPPKSRNGIIGSIEIHPMWCIAIMRSIAAAMPPQPEIIVRICFRSALRRGDFRLSLPFHRLIGRVLRQQFLLEVMLPLFFSPIPAAFAVSARGSPGGSQRDCQQNRPDDEQRGWDHYFPLAFIESM